MFETNKQSKSSVWESVKKITGQARQHEVITEIKTERGIVTEQTQIAEKFNKCFANIGRNRARGKSIPPNNIYIRDTMYLAHAHRS